MREVLEAKLARYEELERQMLDPAIVSNPARVAAIAREHGSLAKLATKYRAFKHVCDEIAELKQMAKSDDQDEREMASAELPGVVERREELWNDLLDLTVGGEDANRTRCVMEIRAGIPLQAPPSRDPPAWTRTLVRCGFARRNARFIAAAHGQNRPRSTGTTSPLSRHPSCHHQ